jgi:hypothetical protein
LWFFKWVLVGKFVSHGFNYRCKLKKYIQIDYSQL